MAEVEARLSGEIERLEAVVSGLQEYRDQPGRKARRRVGWCGAAARCGADPEVLDVVLEARCAEVAESMVGRGRDCPGAPG